MRIISLSLLASGGMLLAGLFNPVVAAEPGDGFDGLYGKQTELYLAATRELTALLDDVEDGADAKEVAPKALELVKKREAFFVELGWSRKARFPQLTMRPSWTRPNAAGPEEEYLCRLGELSRGNDFGWVVEELRVGATQEEMMAYIVAQTQPLSMEVARSRVVSRVEEALRELVQYGLPFLRKHAQPGAPGDVPQAARP